MPRRTRKLLATVGLSILAGGTAFAQAAAPAAPATAVASANEGGFQDIVVTARKRDETSLSVPVVVTAIGQAELQRRAINNLDGIARVVPQLVIGPQGGAIQGGNIALRGISGPDINPFGDSAVAFNIDGVQVTKATVRRMTDTDIAQFEVLKGPQALFYGKNSPGGIISIRTADPTSSLEAKVAAGYEFEAEEKRVEGHVSGPITDTLGFRLAGTFSDINGYFRNFYPADSYVASTSRRHAAISRNWAVRGTLKYEPNELFDARLKVNFGQVKSDGPAAGQQFLSCPFGGRPQSGSADNCKADGTVMAPGSGPDVAALRPDLFGDGFNFLKQNQWLSGLEMNYHLSDAITLTSVTGFYKVKLRQAQNYENDYAIALPSNNHYDNREFSQELRVQSGYDGPLNFVGGAYFAATKSTVGSTTYLFASEASGLEVLEGQGLGFIPLRTPFQINNYEVNQKGKAWSAFLQMTYEPVDVIEINVGGRYSYEKKRLPLLLDGGSGANPFGANPLTMDDRVIPVVGEDSWTDFSPEVTISYRPTQQLTIFGSYKHGFLSGGFNSGSGFGADLSYDPQTIKGFEGGVKALLLGDTLRLNFAAYTYKESDVQVNIDKNAINRILNAAAVKIKGAEVDFNYTPVRGLTLRGAVAYNDAKYSSFPDAPCYPGQTIALGCSPTVEGVFQDLSGAHIPRAPKWSLSGGVGYETPIGEALKLGFSLDANYSSAIFTDLTNDPGGIMPKYALLDGTIRLSEANDQWELALIGRNLTNKHYYVATSQVPFTGSPSGATTGFLGDRFGTVSRGREIMLRVSYKFN